MIAQKLEAGAPTRAVPRDQIPAGWAMFDIDPATEADFARADRRGRAPWSGTGRWASSRRRRSTHGTLAVAHAMAAATAKGAITIVGGGDSAAAVAEAGLDDADDATSRPAAARRSSSSRARCCPAWPHWTTPMMRTLIFAANWKMHHGPPTRAALLRARFSSELSARSAGRTLWFFPPAVSLRRAGAGASASARTSRSARRTCTGSRRARSPARRRVSMVPGAAGAGALVGHSERRHVFGETDAETARKVQALLDAAADADALRRREARRSARRARPRTWCCASSSAVLAGLAADEAGPAAHRLRAGLGDRHRARWHARRTPPRCTRVIRTELARHRVHGPRAGPVRRLASTLATWPRCWPSRRSTACWWAARASMPRAGPRSWRCGAAERSLPQAGSRLT